jgi:hypothetical protein
MLDRLTPEEQLADLRDISAQVANYLSSEAWRVEVDNNSYEINDLLIKCYEIILDELQEFGISFQIATSDLLECWYTAKNLYYIRYFLDADNLIKYLSASPKLDEIESYFTGDEQPTDALTALYEFISPEFDISEFLENVVVDAKFFAHVTACIKQVRELGSLVVIPDLKLATEYLARIKKSRDILRILLDACRSYSPDLVSVLDPVKLNHQIDIYDKEKTQPDTLKIFSKLDRDDVPESLKKLKETKLYEHHIKAKHHIEYWDTHPNEIAHLTPEDVFMLTYHHAEPGVTRDEFVQGATEMRTNYPEIFNHILYDNVTAGTLSEELVTIALNHYYDA